MSLDLRKLSPDQAWNRDVASQLSTKDELATEMKMSLDSLYWFDLPSTNLAFQIKKVAYWFKRDFIDTLAYMHPYHIYLDPKRFSKDLIRLDKLKKTMISYYHKLRAAMAQVSVKMPKYGLSEKKSRELFGGQVGKVRYNCVLDVQIPLE